MAIFKILNESDLRRTEILWSLYTEEEKKSKIGMIVGAIKRIILAILKFIRDKWNKFAAKHRSNKLVASADRLFKGIASKFVKTNNRINSGNANEKEIEKMYEEVREDSTKVQETSEKVVNVVTKEENKQTDNENTGLVSNKNTIPRRTDLSKAREIAKRRAEKARKIAEEDTEENELNPSEYIKNLVIDFDYNIYNGECYYILSGENISDKRLSLEFMIYEHNKQNEIVNTITEYGAAKPNSKFKFRKYCTPDSDADYFSMECAWRETW